MTTIVTIIGGAMKEIQLREAKAMFSAVVDQAASGKPSVITRHGRKVAVVLSYDEYVKLSDIPSFGRLLAAYPGDGDMPDERSGKPGGVADSDVSH